MSGVSKLPQTTNYKHFDAEWYLDTYYTTCEDGDFLDFILKSLHNIFYKGELRGKTLLDIGTGPSIHSVISASSYFDQIYLSDFLESNRKILTDWKNGKRQDGFELCNHVIELEASPVKQTKEERLENIRRKVQNILPVDVTNSSPLGVRQIPVPETITSCLCLEAANATREGYNKSVNNIGTLLNSGGNLVVVGVVNQSFYRVGDYKFMCLSINKQDIRKAFTDNGFDIKHWQDYCPSEKLETDPDFSDFKTAFALHAIKR